MKTVTRMNSLLKPIAPVLARECYVTSPATLALLTIGRWPEH